MCYAQQFTSLKKLTKSDVSLIAFMNIISSSTTDQIVMTVLKKPIEKLWFQNHASCDVH